VLSDNNYVDCACSDPVRDRPATNDQWALPVRRGTMRSVFRVPLSIMLFSCLATPGLAVQSGNNAAAVSRETHKQYVAELIKNPADAAVREKIIKQALTMDPAPIVPENMERNLARGTVLTRTGILCQPLPHASLIMYPRSGLLTWSIAR
jgi:hypothetical protein